ncbi:uncharacterized protein LOC120793277 isoform X2 [Xiphias gladius]|uniref:uncharacterized protein LOC120793277 isoform X2 n=1 Tax=Xiphias gladius TaxID=8245 RepID=UPI001A989B93|nr:uncharacterized protein LOC120793277 isoform X2 [Xiphias gladius]
MPGMCSVPGCKGYKKARSRGVVFHSLPTRDPERCRKWLKAIQNPKFDENTPVNKYGNIRVCSQHFKPHDYEPDIQAELMKTTPRKILKYNVIPSVFSGRQQEDPSTSLPAGDSSRTEPKAPSTDAQASTSVVSGSSVDSMLQWASVPTSISSGAPRTSSQSPPPADPIENVYSLASVDRLNESFHQESEFSWTTASKSDKNTEKDLSQSKTIVNDSCLMELFKKCQTCGQTITKKKVSHCGAQKKVRWSCLGGHRGTWMSSPHLWEAFPEIHLLTALAILFSGGTFTYFKKWAKHLHLNFMGNKTFFEIQKAYFNSEKKQMIRSEQEGIYAKGVHQQLDATPLHIADPQKKMKAMSRGREKGALSSWSRHEKRSSITMTSTRACIQEPTALSSLRHVSASESFDEVEVTIDEDDCNSVKNRISDLDSDMENITETTELKTSGADDSCDEEVYVPLIPQRSTTSELLLECEEEELEPWQKQTSQVHCKDEDDVGELTNDQIDCKAEPSPLQRNAVMTSPPKLKTETEEPVVFNNQGFIVASPQLTSNTEFIGSLGIQCPPRNSFAVVPAGHQQLFQKVATATVTPGAYGGVHSSEVQQISNNPVSLSSVQGPAVYATSSNQLQSDQSNSQALSVSVSRPRFTVLELESTGTSNKQ